MGGPAAAGQIPRDHSFVAEVAGGLACIERAFGLAQDSRDQGAAASAIPDDHEDFWLSGHSVVAAGRPVLSSRFPVSRKSVPMSMRSFQECFSPSRGVRPGPPRCLGPDHG